VIGERDVLEWDRAVLGVEERAGADDEDGLVSAPKENAYVSYRPTPHVHDPVSLQPLLVALRRELPSPIGPRIHSPAR
jgi:hypothetical protein